MRPSPLRRIRLYEFLAAPAHLWLLICAALTGIYVNFRRTDPMQIEPRD